MAGLLQDRRELLLRFGENLVEKPVMIDAISEG
jgi:hypothetical protein